MRDMNKIKKYCNIAKNYDLFFESVDNFNRRYYSRLEDYYDEIERRVPKINEFREGAMRTYSTLVKNLQKYIIAGYDYNDDYRSIYENFEVNFVVYVFNIHRKWHHKIPTYREFINDLCSKLHWEEFVKMNHLTGEVEYDDDVSKALEKELGNFEY